MTELELVREFIQKNIDKQAGARFVMLWNGYNCYTTQYRPTDNIPKIGRGIYILVDPSNKKIRRAECDENYEIFKRLHPGM